MQVHAAVSCSTNAKRTRRQDQCVIEVAAPLRKIDCDGQLPGADLSDHCVGDGGGMAAARLRDPNSQQQQAEPKIGSSTAEIGGIPASTCARGHAAISKRLLQAFTPSFCTAQLLHEMIPQE